MEEQEYEMGENWEYVVTKSGSMRREKVEV